MEFGITPKKRTFVATRFTNLLRDTWMILPFIYVHLHHTYGFNEKQSNQVNWLDTYVLGASISGHTLRIVYGYTLTTLRLNLHTQKQVATIFFDSFQCCDATATIFKSLTHSFACRANWIGFSVFISLFHALCFFLFCPPQINWKPTWGQRAGEWRSILYSNVTAIGHSTAFSHSHLDGIASHFRFYPMVENSSIHSQLTHRCCRHCHHSNKRWAQTRNVSTV